MDTLLFTVTIKQYGTNTQFTLVQQHWEWPSNKTSSTLPSPKDETTPIGCPLHQWESTLARYSAGPGDWGTEPCCYVATCTKAL